MYRTSQERLALLVYLGDAEDITNWCAFDIDALIRNHHLKMVEDSYDFWGINGALFEDEAHKAYAVTDRSGALFQLLWEVWLPDKEKPYSWKPHWKRR